MRIEFLGTAGYHPNSLRHTSGILIPDAAPNDAFLLDAGTGTFRLIERELPPRLHVFLTHAHLDHVAGLTFFLNICLHRDLEVVLYATGATLEAVQTSLFESPLFPLPWEHGVQEITPHTPFEVAGVQIDTFSLAHPDGCIAYRFDWPEKSLAYVTDTAGEGVYADFIRNVDVLIHERNFRNRLEEVARASGHCTSDDLVRVVRDSGAKAVIATHFNPLASGDPLVEDDVYGQIPGVIAAQDGLSVEF